MKILNLLYIQHFIIKKILVKLNFIFNFIFTQNYIYANLLL